MKRLLTLLVAAGGTALIATALWPKHDRTPLLPAEIEAYSFANTLPPIQPPLSALQPDVLADPVLRAAGRVEWAPPDVVYWTCRHLPADRARLAARLMERYDKVVIGLVCLRACTACLCMR